jgi:hypothetical protein
MSAPVLVTHLATASEGDAAKASSGESATSETEGWAGRPGPRQRASASMVQSGRTHELSASKPSTVS